MVLLCASVEASAQCSFEQVPRRVSGWVEGRALRREGFHSLSLSLSLSHTHTHALSCVRSLSDSPAHHAHINKYTHTQGAAGARLATPYLDPFGEEDVGLRRGKPLEVCEKRHQRLLWLWVTHKLRGEGGRGIVRGTDRERECLFVYVCVCVRP